MIWSYIFYAFLCQVTLKMLRSSGKNITHIASSFIIMMTRNTLVRFLFLASTWTLVLSQDTKIDAPLGSKLDAGERVNVVVSFRPDLYRDALDKLKSTRNATPDRVSYAQKLQSTLEEAGKSSQAGVLQLLNTRSATSSFQSFRRAWTSNRVFVRGADAATVKAIAEDGNVAKIQVETALHIPKDFRVNDEENTSPDLKKPPPTFIETGWNVNITRTPEAWAAIGSQGEGVVVGIVDSGVRHTHETLAGKWREEYGWYDPINGSSTPFDDQGHGTGVTGVVLASKDMGYAPGAKYIMCRACDSSGECLDGNVDACLAFMACPTLPDGTAPDCTKAPRVINLSIGDKHGSQVNKEAIQNVRDAGLIPVFAIGNSGPKCRTVESPGELSTVIGVGGSNVLDQCRGGGVGPAFDGRIKPDLIAPSGALFTTGHEDDKMHSLRQGTSMASPAVAAVIALLLVRQPELTFDEAFALITENAHREGIVVPSLRPPAEGCTEDTVDKFPNIHMGYGRLDALAAVEAQTKKLAAAKGSM